MCASECVQGIPFIHLSSPWKRKVLYKKLAIMYVKFRSAKIYQMKQFLLVIFIILTEINSCIAYIISFAIISQYSASLLQSLFRKLLDIYTPVFKNVSSGIFITEQVLYLIPPPKHFIKSAASMSFCIVIMLYIFVP